MSTCSATETRTVGKKRPRTPPPDDASFERVEFQAPVGFTARLDQVAKELGLSRSAFIRLTLLQRIQEHRKNS